MNEKYLWTAEVASFTKASTIAVVIVKCALQESGKVCSKTFTVSLPSDKIPDPVYHAEWEVDLT
jgi:hypothetical protein